MSALDRLEASEVRRRDAMEDELDSLRTRRDKARKDLQVSRERMLSGDDAAKRAASEHQTMFDALDAKISEVQREIRVLDEFGDAETRARFRTVLDKMRQDFHALREQHYERCRALGVALGETLVAMRREFEAMDRAQLEACADIQSLAAALNPRATNQSRGSAGAERAGLGSLRREARRASVKHAAGLGSSKSDLRLALDMD